MLLFPSNFFPITFLWYFFFLLLPFSCYFFVATLLLFPRLTFIGQLFPGQNCHFPCFFITNHNVTLFQLCFLCYHFPVTFSITLLFFPCYLLSCNLFPRKNVTFFPVSLSLTTLSPFYLLSFLLLLFFFYLKSLLFSCYIFPVFLSKHQNDAVSRSSHLYNRNPYTRKDDLHIGTGSGKTPGWKKKVLQNMLNF